MKKKLQHIIYLMSALLLAVLTSCDPESGNYLGPELTLSGDTFITSLVLGNGTNEYEAVIDNTAKTAVLPIPFDCDASAMTVSSISVSEGAQANIEVGERINCTVPRVIRVTNGGAFCDYTVSILRDNAFFTSFTVDGKYQGTIDNTARTINVFVPMEAEVTSMFVTFAVNKGTTVSPESGKAYDFTNPVEFVATYNTAVITYTVTVAKADMSQAPKAFVGIKSTPDKMGNEAKAAWEWMSANVPNSTYIYLQDIKDGKVKLGDYKMLWCHFDWKDWPSDVWDTKDLFSEYYSKGGNILATRDGARYINDVWCIALDQKSPNDDFGGDSSTQLADDLGFVVIDKTHEIFAKLTVEANDMIFMMSSGCSNTNRTLQWAITTDWQENRYQTMDEWKTKTGGKALAYNQYGDPNRITIAEFPSRTIGGNASGVTITVGTPAYEWYLSSGENTYRPAMEQFTKNMINYLCK